MTEAQISPIQQVWNRSQDDPEFRARLIADPRATLLDEMGLAFPDGMEIEIVENTASKMVIALPLVDDPDAEEGLDDVVGFTWCYHVNWFKDPNSEPNPGRIPAQNQFLVDPNLGGRKLGGLG